MEISAIKKWSENAIDVYERLQDDESKTLFMWKMDCLFYNDIDVDTLRIVEMYDDWIIPEEYSQSIVVYGVGQRGETLSKLLKHWQLNQVCFCVTNLAEEYVFNGIRVVSVETAVKEYKESLFLISSQLYSSDMILQLKKYSVSDGRIKKFRLPYPCFVRGNQYFDVFRPKGDEVFVDGGAYDGETTKDFFAWGGCKAYVMEPLKDMYDRIVEENKRNNVIVDNVAIWDCNDTLFFKTQGAGSKISNEGGLAIKAKTIDEIVGEERVTFIKMDIEGSEYKAIIGAKNTIKRNKPRLAICVYHKVNDLVEIGNLLIDMIPEYKFYIRHYTSSMEETVLYATL